MSKWYEELFVNSAKQYDKETFTAGTIAECDFIESEIAFDRQRRILDIGCGTGRHTVELCKRGYDVCGIDLSEKQLVRAREKAIQAGVNPTLQICDARQIPFSNEFELAIMICEGAFPLMETDEMNFQILQGAYRSLKSGGKFIFTTLNGLFPIHHSVEEFCEGNSAEGNAEYHNNSFDLMTFRDHNITTAIDDDGNTIRLECNERYYIPSEITWLLHSIGFVDISIHAAVLGAFSRDIPLRTSDFEMLVICRKK